MAFKIDVYLTFLAGLKKNREAADVFPDVFYSV